VASAAMMVGQVVYMRRELHGFEVGRTVTGLISMTLAAVLFGGGAWSVHHMLEEMLGTSTLAQIVSVGTGLTVGTLLYAGAVLLARVPEAEWIIGRFTRRAT
jgi:hypothetical protein